MAPSITYHKGLLNGPGQNNCFMNSAVQVLWHLDIFRRSFRELSGHACMADSCIFCALKDLFGQLQSSHERALPPDSLRKALALSSADQHRFQLGFMDDAAECFENILLRIHYHIAYNEAEDMCNAKHCIPHQKFAMTLVEQSVCGVCHATSEPLPFTQMVHYVSASALISQAKQMVGTSHPDLFGQLLKKAGGMGDIRDCPSSCGAKIQIRRTLINRPEIVSVGIVWDSDHPSLEHIMSLLDTLRIHLRLSDVFHGSFDGHHGDNTYHQLVGVVTYYGKHYSTFFFHTKLRVWVYFDDANAREVGPHWENVVEKCRRGRYQPLLLLFAAPNGAPVDASNAPKAVTLVDKPTMNVCSKPPMQRGSMSSVGGGVMGGRRSLTPSPEKSAHCNDLTQRRAITPNPEGPINQKCVNDYQNLVQFQEMIFNRPNAACDEQQLAYRQTLLDDPKLAPMRTELVRRDSGNWSGDRNSASSSSSTSLENPYHYIIGKMHLRNGNVPRSPNKSGDLSSGSGNSSGGPADPGYDSFSLSSTDSLPIQQNLKHNFQLAQIPEGHQPTSVNPYLIDENTRVADDCERLCAEVDQLLDRSERAEDLITALTLCNAAVNKARAAMDAPYSNPQTASFATMKHNACVLRARSLHRKLEEPLHNNLKYGESRHTREGSNSSARGPANSHSRQNSKDKGTHSRQNSQELLDLSALNRTSPAKPTTPDHMKTTREKLSPSKNIEIYATLPKNKKGLLSRSSPKTKNFVEDEEYLMKERPGRGLLGNRSKVASKKEVEKRARSEDRYSKNAKEVAAPVVSKEKEKEAKKQSKQEEKQNKKQHKIRRKLLMGGLMRRKNRSMPDLREDEGAIKETPKPVLKETSKDDSMVSSKTAIQSNLNGYLSEGNLEYSGNPNLERSKLMRKSFHGSKVLQFSKVPPPPPLRTTSQLSKNERMLSDARKAETAVYSNHRSWCQEPASLPYMSSNKFEEENRKTDAITYSNGGFLLPHSSTVNTVVTEALIHHDASFQSLPPSIDEPDFVNKVEDMNFQLPPYPSPIHSNAHSRQASEEFPPPPVALSASEPDPSLLNALHEKCERMNLNTSVDVPETERAGGETWLRELQAKQAERRKSANAEHVPNGDIRNVRSHPPVDEVDFVSKPPLPSGKSELQSNLKGSRANNTDDERKNGKKKNVTFCEQVVLVATADDEEADSYIPNPILERVLRTVLHKDSNSEPKEHAVHSVVPLKRTDSWRLSQALKSEEVKSAPPVRSHSQCSTEVTEKPITVVEDFDEVDGPCAPYSPPNQMQNVVAPYVNSNAYSPNYIPASSLCPPHAEYPEPASANGQPSYNGYAETAYSDQHVNANVVQTARKFNDSYPESARYSPICGRDAPPPAQNGYNAAYQPHQTAPSSYQPSVSPPYQPMSLQYYPSQQRSSPQIQQYREQNVPKTQPMTNGNCAQPPLMRQNSNAAHYNRQLPPQDPRRLPVAGLPPTSMSTANTRLSDGQRSQYYNGNVYSQRLPVSSGSTSYGYQNPLNGQGPGRESPRGTLNGHNYGHESPRVAANGNESPRGTLNGHGYGRESPRGSLNGSVHGQEVSRNSLNGSVHGQEVSRNSLNGSVHGQEVSRNSLNGHSHLNSTIQGSSSYQDQFSGPQPNQNSSYLHPANGMAHNGTQGSIQPQQMPIHNSSYMPASSYSLPSQHTSSGPTSTGLHHTTQMNHQYMNGSSQNQGVPANTGPSALQTNHYPQTVSTSTVSHTAYQSVPQNSVAYNGNSLPYQHQVQHPSMNGNANYPPASKFGGPNRGNLPPVYQHPPPPSSNNGVKMSSVYQRVPTPNQQIRQEHNVSPASRHPAYQHPPAPKQGPPLEAKKMNGGFPVFYCNLCRKKQISPPAVYCSDCDAYISRYK